MVNVIPLLLQVVYRVPVKWIQRLGYNLLLRHMCYSFKIFLPFLTNTRYGVAETNDAAPLYSTYIHKASFTFFLLLLSRHCFLLLSW